MGIPGLKRWQSVYANSGMIIWKVILIELNYFKSDNFKINDWYKNYSYSVVSYSVGQRAISSDYITTTVLELLHPQLQQFLSIFFFKPNIV